MNFERASDRDAYHLITMTATIRTRNEALYARSLLNTLRYTGRVTEEMYSTIDNWLDKVESGIAGFKRDHRRQRIPIDERIEPQRLTTEQRRRLTQQRKEPGTGGQ